MIKIKNWASCFTIFLLFLTGCTRHYFYAQKEKIDKSFLASSHILSPDPRQANPPEGESLLIRWDFPLSVFNENLTLQVKVRFYNTEEEVVIRPIIRKRDSCSLFFPHQQILTYLIQALSDKGEVVSEWEHQFWVEWIDIDRDDKASSAKSKRDSVSSQLKQASVRDTP
jgi:hypothetical protein